jgi:hypothetical protein
MIKDHNLWLRSGADKGYEPLSRVAQRPRTKTMTISKRGFNPSGGGYKARRGAAGLLLCDTQKFGRTSADRHKPGFRRPMTQLCKPTRARGSIPWRVYLLD